MCDARHLPAPRPGSRAVEHALGQYALLAKDRRRETAYVLGGANQYDFDETIGRQYPPEELERRREATLSGDYSQDLCTELSHEMLLDLLDKLQMPPAPGAKLRPLMLWVSPEKLMGSRQVLAFLCDVAALEVGQPRRSRLRFVFVDEAHCVVDHGRDFRPEYLRVGTVIAAFRAFVTLLLLTARCSARHWTAAEREPARARDPFAHLAVSFSDDLCAGAGAV